jgi:hypothetical protein
MKGGTAVKSRAKEKIQAKATKAFRVLQHRHNAKTLNLNTLQSLIGDDEAFLSEVSRQLSVLQAFVLDHMEKVGVDKTTRKFTPEAEASLRHAFTLLDKDGGGTLTREEIVQGVRSAATKADKVDMISLSNSVRVIVDVDHEEGIDEDTFIEMLQKKVRGEIGPSASLFQLIYRRIKRIDTCLGISAHHKMEFKSNDGFTALLKRRNIDTHLAEDEDDDMLQNIPLFGGLARAVMQQADAIHLPTLGVYRVFAQNCKRVAYSHAFADVIALCIFVVGGVEAASTYHDEIPKDLEIANYVLLAIFTLEMLLKVFAEGNQPWRYWTGYAGGDPDVSGQKAHENRWNCFDSTIVLSSVATEIQEQLVKSSGVFNFAYARLFRLIRLCRVVRIVRYMPEMLTILDGLAHGARSVMSIMCLFFAVNVIYACFGTLLLGQRDPLHFGQFSASMLNLYSVTTLEWVDLLQANLWGCSVYNTGDYLLIEIPNSLTNSSKYQWDTRVLNGPGEWAPSVDSADSVLDPYIA